MSYGISGVSDPSLRDVLDLHEREMKLTFNCHHIGRIEQFNPSKQTAQVSILYKQTSLDQNGNEVHTDYPVLNDVPVVCLGGGAASLTFPVAVGDECVLLFNDRDIDAWFSSGQNGVLETARLHSFADAIAIVGLRSSLKVLTNYDSTRAVLQFGTTMVGVSSSLVKIANNNYTLGTLIQNLCTQIGNLATQCAAITVSSFGAVPNNNVALSNIQTQISNIANQLKGLIE